MLHYLIYRDQNSVYMLLWTTIRAISTKLDKFLKLRKHSFEKLAKLGYKAIAKIAANMEHTLLFVDWKPRPTFLSTFWHPLEEVCIMYCKICVGNRLHIIDSLKYWSDSLHIHNFILYSWIWILNSCMVGNYPRLKLIYKIVFLYQMITHAFVDKTCNNGIVMGSFTGL